MGQSLNKRVLGIIVIGGHVQALGIARIIGKLGVRVIILDNSYINIARHSKYCSKFIKYEENKLLDKLLLLGEKNSFSKYVLMPTNDEHVAVLSKNKNLLEKYYIVGTDNWTKVQKCYNKRITYKIANDLGVPIPTTRMPDSLSELSKMKIEFPCIIKPAVMHTFYKKFKRKVFICANQEELFRNYKKAIEVIPKNEIIIQSIINTVTDGLYSACFLHNEDDAIQCFVGRRARQHPPDFGNATTFAQIVESEALLKYAKLILNKIQYKGLCEVEFMYDRSDSKFKFLEINPRTWKWHTIAEKANINLLENYLNMLLKRPFNRKGVIQKASFRHLITDIPTIIQYKKKGLFKKYPKCPVQYAVFDKRDPMPFVFELLYLPILIFKR